MVFPKINTTKLNSWLAQLILLLGAVLRIKIYFGNRSLFIDEGALACEVVSKSFGALFQPLHYQFSPPLFSTAVKLSTNLFGANEYALRFTSLLAGLLTLYIFYRIAKKQLYGINLIFPLGLLAFGLPFLQYSTECKQYGIDVLMTTSLLLLFFKYQHKPKDSKFFICTAIVGMLIVWCSMPSVFILAGLGGYFLLKEISEKKSGQLVNWIFAISTWLISFTIYYFTILKEDVGIDSLNTFHEEYFFPLIPSSINELTRGLDLLLNILKKGVGATAIVLIPALFLFVHGILVFWRKEKLLCLALLLPFLLTIITSGLGLYSLIGRMTLFLMPLLFLFLGKGMRYIQEKNSILLSVALAIYSLIAFINLNSYQFFNRPYQTQEIRPILSYIHEHQKENQSVYIHHLSSTTFRFYQYYHNQRNQFKLDRVTETTWRDHIPAIAQKQSFPCWVVMVHMSESEMEAVLNKFKEKGQIADHVKRKNASAWLIKP